jgi:hypothetical protein
MTRRPAARTLREKLVRDGRRVGRGRSSSGLASLRRRGAQCYRTRRTRQSINASRLRAERGRSPISCDRPLTAGERHCAGTDASVKSVLDHILGARPERPLPRFGPEVRDACRRASELERDEMIELVEGQRTAIAVRDELHSLDGRRHRHSWSHGLRIARHTDRSGDVGLCDARVGRPRRAPSVGEIVSGRTTGGGDGVAGYESTPDVAPSRCAVGKGASVRRTPRRGRRGGGGCRVRRAAGREHDDRPDKNNPADHELRGRSRTRDSDFVPGAQSLTPALPTPRMLQRAGVGEDAHGLNLTSSGPPGLAPRAVLLHGIRRASRHRASVGGTAAGAALAAGEASAAPAFADQPGGAKNSSAMPSGSRKLTPEP